MKTVWKNVFGRTAIIDVGRNQPCPCRSGKKFKKCCIDKVTLAPLRPQGKKHMVTISDVIKYQLAKFKSKGMK